MLNPVLLIPAVLALSPATQTSPNVLLIVGDDIGVDIVAAYGEHAQPAKTPTLDGLASEGVRFTNAWAHPTCSPSRASILTGRHAFRHGVLNPAAAATLPAAEVTLPQVLKEAGYSTALFGKWHLGEAPESQPHRRGFDYFAGSLGAGVGDYFSWEKTVAGDTDSTDSTANTANTASETTLTTTYATRDVQQEARAWIAAQATPWFAMLAYNAPHSPMHIPPSDLLSAETAASLKGRAGARCSRRDAANPSTACYRAMVEAMDASIGQLLRWLEARGTLDDTLVIFVGDNGTPGGGVIADGVFDPTKAKKTVYEGGVNVPLIVYGGASLPVRRGVTSDGVVQALDLFATIAELAGATEPTEPTVTDAVSLTGLLTTQGALPPRSTIYTEYAQRRQGIDKWAISDGALKVMVNEGVSRCFDLSVDPGEAIDLYAAGPSARCDALAAKRIQQSGASLSP